MKTFLITIAVFAAVSFTTGCHWHLHGRLHHGLIVTIPHGHLHSAHCGHFLNRGHWHHLRGHVHGHGCGHLLIGGHWTLESN